MHLCSGSLLSLCSGSLLALLLSCCFISPFGGCKYTFGNLAWGLNSWLNLLTCLGTTPPSGSALQSNLKFEYSNIRQYLHCQRSNPKPNPTFWKYEYRSNLSHAYGRNFILLLFFLAFYCSFCLNFIDISLGWRGGLLPLAFGGREGCCFWLLDTLGRTVGSVAATSSSPLQPADLLCTGLSTWKFSM